MASITLPEPFASIPRTDLLFGPSPIHHLPRISEALGGKVEIWAKREDCNSGIAFGGNKTRKLEYASFDCVPRNFANAIRYLVPDALEQGCDTLISIGGVQSNHTRQVAGIAAKMGLKAKLIQEHWVPIDSPSYTKVGNIQLTRLMGVTPILDPSPFGIEHKSTLLNLTNSITSEGGKPYYIPAGASDHPLGGLGFARWAFEVVIQEQERGIFFNTIIVCAVTGSTFAGMIAGFKYIELKLNGKKRRIIGIDASAKPTETRAQILRIARFTGVKIGLQESDIGDADVELDESDEVWGED
ncbi:hypothetical protein G7Y89_g15071 [Cudoniella acicularis]|uniref:Tryptophan synthase beta chain-like PALP domain-containing protein n=1 Tax=Cudoniella acicularis TaxID=354080 RepID=A0A8H4QUC6_9HELO|nr:hypothetical protein G7Y89_g15071 [Cudoniella acicularis]